MSSTIAFNKHFEFEYEKVERLSPLVRRIVAQNPNYFTFYGTNTYIVGNGEVALIDPGPDSEEHLAAIVDGLDGETITHIFITHTHYDHWPAYHTLQSKYGAKTYGFHPSKSNRKDSASQSASERSLSTQERFEITGFEPDVGVEHGSTIEGGNWTIECVFTPGHASDHMCYQLREEDTLFSGDHIMGWSTSVISPPSGNMREYMDSLNLLLKREDGYYRPAHGPGIPEPMPYVKSFVQHRKERFDQILNQIRMGVHTIPEMVVDIYRDISPMLHPAAERSTLAAMEYLIEKGIVKCQTNVGNTTTYYLADQKGKIGKQGPD